jgi:hypothetical protein
LAKPWLLDVMTPGFAFVIAVIVVAIHPHVFVAEL